MSTTKPNKIALAVAGLATAAVAGFGILTATSASAEPTAAPTAAATTDQAGQSADERGGRGMKADHAHTEVTGDEAQKVIDAVKAKDAAVTIETVRKDADGTYDALGTKDGAKVMFDVSGDLATVSEAAGKGPGGDGSGLKGGHAHTEVTGDEAQKVMDAVKAKDAAVTIETVRKDADGTYDALGTKDGAKVMFDVSADLATVTQATGR